MSAIIIRESSRITVLEVCVKVLNDVFIHKHLVDRWISTTCRFEPSVNPAHKLSRKNQLLQCWTVYKNVLKSWQFTFIKRYNVIDNVTRFHRSAMYLGLSHILPVCCEECFNSSSHSNSSFSNLFDWS